jgi:hypothetical protein
VDPQLVHDVLDVSAQRVLGNEQAVADLARREPLRQRAQHFQLTRRELLHRPTNDSAAPGQRHALRDLVHDGPRQEDLAGVRGADGTHDFLARPVLRQVAVCAGANGVEDGLVVRDGGEHDHARARPAGLDRAGCLGTGPVGQAVVHQDDVHGLSGGALRLADAVRDPDHLDIGLPAEESGERVSQELMIVHQQDTDRRRLPVVHMIACVTETGYGGKG